MTSKSNIQLTHNPDNVDKETLNKEWKIIKVLNKEERNKKLVPFIAGVVHHRVGLTELPPVNKKVKKRERTTSIVRRNNQQFLTGYVPDAHSSFSYSTDVNSVCGVLSSMNGTKLNVCEEASSTTNETGNISEQSFTYSGNSRMETINSSSAVNAVPSCSNYGYVSDAHSSFSYSTDVNSVCDALSSVSGTELNVCVEPSFTTNEAGNISEQSFTYSGNSRMETINSSSAVNAVPSSSNDELVNDLTENFNYNTTFDTLSGNTFASEYLSVKLTAVTITKNEEMTNQKDDATFVTKVTNECNTKETIWNRLDEDCFSQSLNKKLYAEMEFSEDAIPLAEKSYEYIYRKTETVDNANEMSIENNENEILSTEQPFEHNEKIFNDGSKGFSDSPAVMIFSKTNSGRVICETNISDNNAMAMKIKKSKSLRIRKSKPFSDVSNDLYETAINQTDEVNEEKSDVNVSVGLDETKFNSHKGDDADNRNMNNQKLMTPKSCDLRDHLPELRRSARISAKKQSISHAQPNCRLQLL